YVAVTNIPNDYHASDLRAHFSALVESRSFICFHFRHRPEKSPEPSEGSNFPDSKGPKYHSAMNKSIKTKSGKRCCIVKLFRNQLRQLLKHNGNNWTDAIGVMSEGVCKVTSITLTKSISSKDVESDAIDEAKLLQMPELNPPDKMPNGNVGTPTLVFLDMIQNCLLPHNFIKKLQLKFPKSEGRRLYSNVEFDYCTRPGLSDSIIGKRQNKLLHKLSSEQSVTANSQESIAEHFQKPTQCQIASSRDNSVVSDMQPGVRHSEESCDSKTQPSASGSTILPCSQSDKEMAASCEPLSSNVPILDTKNSPFKHPSQMASSSLSAQERRRKQKADRQETRKLMAEGIEERLIAIEGRYHNDEDAEEWDRHEASEDDPSNQERNKERLYETEEETPWEKGGPGVVFYTDANFWQAREG
ncbi:hypothetical protein EGW08_022973, partial [Elysia chlorotica]